MTQEEFDKASLLDQILYDTTGMLVENHPSIAEAMDKYHQAKLKLLGIADVSRRTFSLEEENAIWGIIKHLSKEQHKNPQKIWHRDDVFNMIYEELDWSHGG